MECLKQLLNHRADGGIFFFFLNLIVKIVMEHVFHFAFQDLESLKFSENFRGNFARQILWIFFFFK